jgi:D-hexose-6-phosphate mutarotase
MNIESIDVRLIQFFKKSFEPLARFGLFVVFFWFGILKVIGLSPASGVVQQEEWSKTKRTLKTQADELKQQIDRLRGPKSGQGS